MITVEAQGIQYEQIISVEAGMSLGALVRDFFIVVARPENRALPFKGGEQVIIRVDGEAVCDGFIDEVNPSYTKGNHTISMSGRSRAQDLVDSTLAPFAINTDISLVKAIEVVLDQIGLDFSVKNTVTGLSDFNVAEDKIGADVGANAFEFIDQLARKRQALLTSDASGNIIIARSGTEKNPVSLRNIIDGDSNIISASARYSSARRFNKYVVMSQLNTATPAFRLNAEQASNQQEQAIDTGVRSGRQMVIQAEKSSSSAECKTRAIWQANIAKAQSRSYTATVQGVTQQGGGVWVLNTLQRVIDEYADIDEDMLIDSIRFNQSKDSGTITTLGLVDKDAYTLELAEPIPVESKDNEHFSFA